MNLKLLNFQKNAVAELRSKINTLWQNEECTQIILHSPTGSGKTLMTCALIDSLQNVEPTDVDLGDVAFFWITLNNELAMQSKDKFYRYFMPNLRNNLSTFDDCGSTLRQNEVLFVNWQKLSQDKKKKRLLLRRPAEEYEQKESGFYFEDLMENTAKAGRRIIMIIDESHSNVNTENSQDIIKIINPKLIIKVSATPFKSVNDEKAFKADCFDGKAAIVTVDEADVVAEGLIKEEIVCQTEEDLNRFGGGDIDNTMLALAKQRRDDLLNEWRRLGHNINPLVLIQLPNDEEDNKEEGKETKEAFTKRILVQTYGVREERIATWLADKPLKPEWRISDNDSPIDFLIFKFAAGTGWDCPRAHILVMFREIKSPVFHKQTLGRIKRMAVNGNELQDSMMLRRGYLYTTYKTNEVNDSFDATTPNKPKTNKSVLDPIIKKRAIATTVKTEIMDIFTKVDEESEEEEPVIKEYEVAESFVNMVAEVWEKESEDFSGISFEFEEAKINTDEEKKDVYISKEKIDIKKNSIVQIITKRANEVAQVTVTPEQKKKIEETIQIALETSVGKRESELILDPELKTQYLSRADYGDLGQPSLFQHHFLIFMHRYFGTNNASLGYADDKTSLEERGLELNVSPTWEINVGKVYRFGGKKDEEGKETNVKISTNDISRMFEGWCFDLLKELRGGNIKRSYGPLKHAMYQWFMQLNVPSLTGDQWRRVFVYDCQKDANSVFKKAIAYALNEYKPILDKWLKEREAKELQAKESFRLKTQMAFDDTCSVFEPSSKSFQQPFYLKSSYGGRDNETSFIRFLEGNSDVMNWYKNEDHGKGALSILYHSSENNEKHLFNPDWIVLYTNGDIGLYDTKSGNTGLEKSQETRDKLKALKERIDWLNKNSKHHYRGGIYEPKDGGWELYEDV